MRRLFLLSLPALAIACSFPPIDYSGRSCSEGACPQGFVCVAAVCYREGAEPLSDGGFDGGDDGGVEPADPLALRSVSSDVREIVPGQKGVVVKVHVENLSPRRTLELTRVVPRLNEAAEGGSWGLRPS